MAFLDYKGDQEPDILTEPIVFKSTIDRPILIGYIIFQSLLVACALVIGLGITFLNWPSIDVFSWPVLLATFLISVAVAAIEKSKNDGLSMKVDSQGITVERDRIVIQRCPWSDTRVRQRRFNQRELADQLGKPFPFEVLKAGSADMTLVNQVVNTRLQRLAQPRPANLLPAGLICGVATCCGWFSMQFLRTQSEAFADYSAQPDIDLAHKVLAFLPVLAIVIASLGWFAPIIFLAILKDNLEKRKPKNPEGIQRHVDRVRGRVEAATMVDWQWYRYVDGIGWRSESGALLMIAIFAPFTILFPFFPLLVPPSPRVKEWYEPMLLAFCVACYTLMCGSFAVSGMIGLVQRRRGLDKRLRKIGSDFELMTSEGRTLQLETKRMPKLAKLSDKSFGALYWKFKASDGKTYRFDPRYLVPVESEENPTSEVSH